MSQLREEAINVNIPPCPDPFVGWTVLCGQKKKKFMKLLTTMSVDYLE